MRRGAILKICGICAVLAGIAIMTYRGYTKRFNEYASGTAIETLTEMAEQQMHNISSGLEADGRTLVNLALHWSPEYDWEGCEYESEQFRCNTHFDSLDFFDTTERHLWGGSPFLTLPKNFSGKENMSVGSVHYSLVSGEDAFILISTPVFNMQGERLGTLTGTHSLQTMSHALLPFFEGRGYTYLLSEQREVIISSRSANAEKGKNDFWESFKEAKHVGGDTFEQMEEKIARGETGNTVISINGKKGYVHYQPFGINEWCLVTTVSQNEISRRTDLVMQSALHVSGAIVFAFTLIILYILCQQKKYEKELRRTAYYDEFCDCPNLSSFRITAQKFINEHPDELMMLVKLDIERFKLVNQTMGIEMGDHILKNMAAALRQNTDGDERRFARAHDDTFYILHRYKNQEELKAREQKFYACFKSLMGENFHYKIKFVSGTYYISLENCKSAMEAIEKVNIAHRRAKDIRAVRCDYDETFVRQALRKKDIEERMEMALEQEEFKVYLQAQNSLDTNGINGAEALVRWHAGTEDLYPDEFIPIFEENNFILKLDMYVFEKVCSYIRQWIDAGLEPVAVSINFARNHLANPEFASELLELADKYRVPRHLLGVELTERVIAQDESVSLQFLEALHESGFTVSMDDFGTGYSSLGLLKNIPVDVIKLDKSFFDRAFDQPRTQAVLTNVIQLARDLDAYTIAEGVETEELVDMLRIYGCDAAQGYYFARPIKETEFRKLLKQTYKAADKKAFTRSGESSSPIK